MYNRNREEKKSSWPLKVMIFLGCVAGVFIFLAISKETYHRRQVQNEIYKLQEEARRIEGDNLRLAGKISYFESRDYQEKEIRDKLNLQDPKENVVVIDSGTTFARIGAEPTVAGQEILIKKANPQKWWDYFFE